MSGKLIEVNGKLLKSLYGHYGMHFDYDVAEKFARKSDYDKYGIEYPALINTLVGWGYAEVIEPNVGNHKGQRHVYLSFGVPDLILYNSSHDWKRWIFWAVIASLWVVIPVGAAVTNNFILTVLGNVFGLDQASSGTLAVLITIAYLYLIGAAFVYQDHRRPPRNT